VILLEFAAQGIRGVAPAGGRATLRPGYNVVAADGPTLRRLLEALLYPDPRDAEALPRATGGPANAPLRAGLTLVGNDRVTYRLVRDFAAGAQLHRFDAEKRSFALVSQDLAEIGKVLQRTVGVPPQPRLGALLALAAADLPSKQGAGGALPSAAAPQRASLTPEQAKRRLEALRGELEKARVAEKLQYEQDGLQARQFKLEEALKAGARLQQEVERAEAALADLGAAATAIAKLGDPDARLAAYEKASAKRAEAAAKVDAERTGIAAAEEAGGPNPFWKDPLFWAGVGAGAVLAAIGIVGAVTRSDLRYVGLLDVPAFGWSAWLALRWVGALETWEKLGRRRRIVDDWEAKVEAQWQKDAADVLEATKALGLSKPAELREALGRAREAEAAVSKARAQLAEWEATPEAQGARAEKAKVEEALRGVEAKLSAEVGGFVRDVRSVESEIQRLESEAAAPPAPATPVAAPAAPQRPAGEPLRTLLERAAAELGGSPTAAARAVAQKASQTLTGLSFQRLQAVQIDDRGNVQVQTGGRPVPALTLPVADRDLVFLALKLAFMEQALAAGKLVAVSEDAFGGLSEGGRRFAARLLKQIARPGQLVHATTDPSFKEAADHAA
jgi:tetratricopeptide (TPR) repeat protein